MRAIVRVALLLLCPVLPAVSPARAQAPAPPSLPPVVVEGARMPSERTSTEREAREEIQRVPGAVNIVSEEQIRESRAANLKDVLDSSRATSAPARSTAPSTSTSG